MINVLLHEILGTAPCYCPFPVDYASVTRSLFSRSGQATCGGAVNAPNMCGTCCPEISDGNPINVPVETTADRLEGLDLAALDRYLRSLGIGRDGELRAGVYFRWPLQPDLPGATTRRQLAGAAPAAARADAVGARMAREYRVVAALQDTPVPVARAIALCEDDSVLGAPSRSSNSLPGKWCAVVPNWKRFNHTVIDGCVDS